MYNVYICIYIKKISYKKARKYAMKELNEGFRRGILPIIYSISY